MHTSKILPKYQQQVLSLSEVARGGKNNCVYQFLREEGTKWSVPAGAGVNTTLEHAGLVLEQHHSSTPPAHLQPHPTRSSNSELWERRQRSPKPPESKKNARKNHEFAFEKLVKIANPAWNRVLARLPNRIFTFGSREVV